MRLSELGEISKAKDEENRRGIRGRDVAGAGGAAFLGGNIAAASGVRSGLKHLDEIDAKLANKEIRLDQIPSKPRGVKRFVGGGAAAGLGTAAMLTGAGIGAYNMRRASTERKRAHQLELARMKRG